MTRKSKAGKLYTGRTMFLLVVLVGVLGATIWGSDYLPIRLRHDGIYGGNAPATAALIDRPRLYLPEPRRKRSAYVRVTRVVDGDTIKVKRRGKEEYVRLIGIDTPEVGRNRVDANSRAWQATMFLFDLLEDDAQVKLEYDRERYDKYDRTLAYVYLPDGRMINEVMLRQGWATTLRIPPNTRYANEFAEIDH